MMSHDPPKIGMQETFKRLNAFVIDKRLKNEQPLSCNWAECVIDDSIDNCGPMTINDLETAPAKLDDLKVEVQDE